MPMQKEVFAVLGALLLSGMACLAGGTSPQGEEEGETGIFPIPEAPTAGEAFEQEGELESGKIELEAEPAEVQEAQVITDAPNL